MSGEPDSTPPRTPAQPGGPTADTLDRVVWDYDPEDELLSPLVTTSRYFRDFPWHDADAD